MISDIATFHCLFRWGQIYVLSVLVWDIKIEIRHLTDIRICFLVKKEKSWIKLIIKLVYTITLANIIVDFLEKINQLKNLEEKDIIMIEQIKKIM